MQNTISECTTHRPLKQMGYSRVPLLSDKNSYNSPPPHQNFAWSNESQFQLWHSDGRVRKVRKQLESMDPSCLVPTVQTGVGGVTVFGIFSWPLWTSWTLFKHHSLSEHCCWPWPYLYDHPSSGGYFQRDNAPCIYLYIEHYPYA